MKVVFVEIFIFKGILKLSATAKNGTITFSKNLFGYLALWFVYAPYILNFRILNFKVVNIFKIQICSGLSYLEPSGTQRKEFQEKKLKTKNLAPLSL
jgi:hypothetical protein